MYRVEDNFFHDQVFQNVLRSCSTYPINVVPDNYDGCRRLYSNRNYLTKKSVPYDHFIVSLFHKPKDHQVLKIEFANDVDGFWLKPHSDHPAKEEVIVIYLEGQENNGTTFHKKTGDETVKFVPNRAIHFNPDSLDTWDEKSCKHSVQKVKIENVRRTLIVNYVNKEKWNELDNCWI